MNLILPFNLSECDNALDRASCSFLFATESFILLPTRVCGNVLLPTQNSLIPVLGKALRFQPYPPPPYHNLRVPVFPFQVVTVTVFTRRMPAFLFHNPTIPTLLPRVTRFPAHESERVWTAQTQTFGSNHNLD
ncbi:hypothetical protein CDAR_417221 [Caerostris darwini]|uniref:Uncharacterized protein n=1 Tax=Caerostris darwini TaxID=1538125 RepID=A0AAV4X7A8_9ARAC|nr:hypothetical protein CDAR_417221 [Caerostris darwini]